MSINPKHAEFLLQQLQVLVVDDNPFMRAIVRGLLNSIGVKSVIEAGDGIAALDKIREETPDVVILDWEMPLLNGPELVRIVRSPGIFPTPDLPIIMLSAHGEQWRILESVKLGVNEFLCKPVSAKALFERLISILLKPRASVQLGKYYGPVAAAPAPDPASRRSQQRAAGGLTPACGLVAAAAAPARREEQVEQEPDRHDDQRAEQHVRPGPSEAPSGVILYALGREAGFLHQLINGDAEMGHDRPQHQRGDRDLNQRPKEGVQHPRPVAPALDRRVIRSRRNNSQMTVRRHV